MILFWQSRPLRNLGKAELFSQTSSFRPNCGGQYLPFQCIIATLCLDRPPNLPCRLIERESARVCCSVLCFRLFSAECDSHVVCLVCPLPAWEFRPTEMERFLFYWLNLQTSLRSCNLQILHRNSYWNLQKRQDLQTRHFQEKQNHIHLHSATVVLYYRFCLDKK